MFNIQALINLINVNNDNKIEKTEVQEFQKTQSSPSIFTGYFNSINSDISLGDFESNLINIMYQGNEEPKLNFKSKEHEEAYNEMVKQNVYNNCKMFAWKCGEEEYNKLFDQFYAEAEQEGVVDGIYEKFANLKITKPITLEAIEFSGCYGVQIPADYVFDGSIDWSNSMDVLKQLSFNENTFSQTPPEHLPIGFDPKKVIENGRSIGLGIDQAHEKYKGNGVSFAMIDSGFPEHEALNFKEYNVSQYADKSWVNHFHGGAVSYIAQQIAPEADCYFYAENNGGNMEATTLDNLKSILEKNKTLPADKKIRVVSMSMPLYGGEESKKVVEELEAQGVWVFYSGCPEDDDFGYLGKKDPTGNPNDFNNHYVHNGSHVENDELRYNPNILYVNSGDRTVPDESSPNAYRHDSIASQSWSIPVIAGYYALACEADPSMTKEHFMELARQTAQTIESDLPIYVDDGGEGKQVGRTEEKYPVKVLDINALLQAIEKEKSN